MACTPWCWTDGHRHAGAPAGDRRGGGCGSRRRGSGGRGSLRGSGRRGGRGSGQRRRGSGGRFGRQRGGRRRPNAEAAAGLATHASAAAAGVAGDGAPGAAAATRRPAFAGAVPGKEVGTPACAGGGGVRAEDAGAAPRDVEGFEQVPGEGLRGAAWRERGVPCRQRAHDGGGRRGRVGLPRACGRPGRRRQDRALLRPRRERLRAWWRWRTW